MKKRKLIPLIITIFCTAGMIYAGVFWAVAVILNLMLFAVLLFLFYDRKDVLNERMVSNVFGTTELKLRTMINFGRKKIFEIKKVNSAIKEITVKKRVETIIELCDYIMDELKKDPSVIKKLRRFFNYYLDSVLKIVTNYEKISNFKYKIDNKNDILLKTEKSLDLIKSGFESLLKSLKESDADDLDLEIQVIANSLNSDFQVKKNS